MRYNTERERAEKLEQALNQTRDENTKVKNQIKEVKENGIGNREHTSHAEFKQFRDHVLREIADLKQDKEKQGMSVRKTSSEGTEEKRGDGKTKKKKRKKKKKQLKQN